MKKIVIIVGVIVLAFGIFLIVDSLIVDYQNGQLSGGDNGQNQSSSQTPSNYGIKISDEDIKMLEDYLTENYQKPFKVVDYYYYDNGDLGINAGKHYSFEFEPIDGLEISGSLDFYGLSLENMNWFHLNITNIDKANELKSYVEANTNLVCKMKEFREIKAKPDYYDYFSFTVGNYDSYSVSGRLYLEDTIDRAKELELSKELTNKTGITIEEGTTLLEVLQAIGR